MKKTIFIGEYLFSFPGGAERSILEVLKNKKIRTAITFDNTIPQGKTTNQGITCYNYHLLNIPWRIPRLFKNQTLIKKILDKHQFDEVITQSLIAPIIAEYCIKQKKPYTYYLRDELQLNIFRNYETGARYYLKCFKDIIQKRYLNQYKNKNIIAINNAKTLVVNSNFMKKELQKRFKKNSIVQYPEVKINKIKVYNPKYITFIGAGNSMKGYDLAKSIAKLMPEEKFLFVGKKHLTKNNVEYLPWQKNRNVIYSKTKLLIVPSKWDEAFGRIVIEAQKHDIPVLVSNKGGLTEAVSKKENIVYSQSPTNWKNKIEKTLKHYDARKNNNKRSKKSKKNT